MTFAVRASLHSWRRHSSVSRPSAFLDTSSLSSPRVAKNLQDPLKHLDR